MMKDLTIFYFSFFKLIDDVNPMTGSRISIWREDDMSYLMPSEFKNVVMGEGFYKVEMKLLDHKRFYSKDSLGKKFYFGPPNHIIGYGILEGIQTPDSSIN